MTEPPCTELSAPLVPGAGGKAPDWAPLGAAAPDTPAGDDVEGPEALPATMVEPESALLALDDDEGLPDEESEPDEVEEFAPEVPAPSPADAPVVSDGAAAPVVAPVAPPELPLGAALPAAAPEVVVVPPFVVAPCDDGPPAGAPATAVELALVPVPGITPVELEPLVAPEPPPLEPVAMVPPDPLAVAVATTLAAPAVAVDSGDA